MRKLLVGGAIAAFALSPALAQAPVAPKEDRKNRVETRAEVPGHVARMFARLDADKDGTVTTAELDARQAARTANMKQRMDKRAHRFDPAKMLARLDSNKDGKLTKTEVDAAKAARAQAKGAKGKPARGSDHLFARVDANKDNVLTLAELQAMPRPDPAKRAKMRAEHGGKAGMKGGMKQHLFGQADLNQDGKVTLSEAQQAALVQFDRADANRDGKVTRDERKAMRQAMRTQRGS